MKKMFAITLLVISGLCAFNVQADEVVRTQRVVTMRFRDMNGNVYTRQVPVYVTQLPEAVINPATFRNTNAQISYVNTNQLIQRGREILQYVGQNGTNAAGYQPHYDPNIHTSVYMRIPKTVDDIYGDRAR